MTRAERDKAIRILQWLHDNNFLFRSTEEDVKFATKLAMQALLQESCEDAISRQALLDDFGFSEKTRKWGGDHSGYNTMMLYEIQDVIESAPSVKPQASKTGHWKSTIDGNPICSECGFVSESEDGYFVSRYYPNCGAKMVEPQEGEEKE